MRSRWLKSALVVFLGWYISGPLFMTVDCWDNAHEEVQDIALSTGGFVTIAGAAFLVGIAGLKTLEERSAADSHRQTNWLCPSPLAQFFTSLLLAFALQLLTTIAVSPPSQLRI
jgi:hypothetical protein